MIPTEAALNRIRELFANPIRVEPMPGSGVRDERSISYKPPSIVTELSEVSEVSEMSPMSEVSHTSIADPEWSDIELDMFEERAAILEFDASFSRDRAEFYAKGLLASMCEGRTKGGRND